MDCNIIELVGTNGIRFCENPANGICYDHITMLEEFGPKKARVITFLALADNPITIDREKKAFFVGDEEPMETIKVPSYDQPGQTLLDVEPELYPITVQVMTDWDDEKDEAIITKVTVNIPRSYIADLL